MRISRSFFGFALCILLSSQGYAMAPIVEDSENFAVFDEDNLPSSPREQKYAANEEPIAKVLPENKASESLSAQVRAMQQEIQSLRGELEVQAHAIETLKNNQTNFYKDIDARLEKPAQASTHPQVVKDQPLVTIEPTTTIPSNTNNANATLANPADEQVAYLAAYDLVKAKRYDEALIAMKSFSEQYPSGGYTANAAYWTGELYLVKKQPAEAMASFEIVLQRFPNSSKAAASALKIGYALSELGRKQEAREKLNQVIKNYPDTAAAQLAKNKLESL